MKFIIYYSVSCVCLCFWCMIYLDVLYDIHLIFRKKNVDFTFLLHFIEIIMFLNNLCKFLFVFMYIYVMYPIKFNFIYFLLVFVWCWNIFGKKSIIFYSISCICLCFSCHLFKKYNFVHVWCSIFLEVSYVLSCNSLIMFIFYLFSEFFWCFVWC